jgi:hypothetical protein
MSFVFGTFIMLLSMYLFDNMHLSIPLIIILALIFLIGGGLISFFYTTENKSGNLYVVVSVALVCIMTSFSKSISYNSPSFEYSLMYFLGNFMANIIALLLLGTAGGFVGTTLKRMFLRKKLN